MKSNEWHKIKFDKEMARLCIVSDAMILQKNLAGGRSIPLVILDTTNHKEIERAIELHKEVDQGESKYSWGKTKDDKMVFLLVELESPTMINFVILFDLNKHVGLIDLIIESQLLFIQGGKDGDRLICNLDAPRLLLEIPQTKFVDEWNKLYKRAMKFRFRTLGVKNKDVISVSEAFNAEWHDFTKKRFK